MGADGRSRLCHVRRYRTLGRHVGGQELPERTIRVLTIIGGIGVRKRVLPLTVVPRRQTIMMPVFTGFAD